jgi:hypothetical protein
MQTRQKIAAFLAVQLVVAAAGIALTSSPGRIAQAGEPAEGQITMHVMKSPTCGCCGAWVDLARAEGYHVTVEHIDDIVAMKDAAGVPDAMWSCHTAEVAGYTVEGHVPFAAIRKLLEERPDIDGIAVPGMPAGSPGMGDDPQAVYDVLAHGRAAGAGEVFFTAGH